MTWLWLIVLLTAVSAAHWGAERLNKPLKKLRRQWGFTVAAGGAFIGLAAASPEVGINVTSAVRGSAEIGLGVMLGSNVIAIPLMVATSYLATRKRQIPDHQNHEAHIEERMVAVDPQAVWVQALPYVAMVGLMAVLVLPSGWRGLQPIDGVIMIGAYIIYAAQALLRGRKQGEDVQWTKKEVLLAAAGVGAIAVGTFFTVMATEKLISAWEIATVVGGLFITAPVAALPEVFATWYVARGGQITSAVTSVIGDHAVTISLAFLPLAVVTVPVENFSLLWVNVLFVGIMPITYAICIHFGGRRHGFQLWQVYLFAILLAMWILIVWLWALPQNQQQDAGSGTNAGMWILAGVEAILWYLFLAYAILAVRRPKARPWLDAAILLVLGYLAFVACPWVRETQAWEQLLRAGG